MNEYDIVVYEDKRRKKNGRGKFFRNLVTVSLVCVLSFGSLGYGIGRGISYVNSDDTIVENDNFKFEESLETLEENMATLEATVENASSRASIVDTSAISSKTNTDSYSDVISVVSDSIVSINVTATSTDYFGRTSSYESAGSGIIFSENDETIYIATNNHVIDGAKAVTISVNDDSQVPASYIGSDSVSDLAVISVLKSDLESAGIDYAIAIFGDSETLQVGDTAIAIGNALGMGKTATKGIISALNKTLQIDSSSLTVIQTDAAINPGNSGGALINSKGEVIGINTAKIVSAEAEGVGYSIPMDIAKPILTSLLEQGSAAILENENRVYIGIEGFTITDDVKNAYALPSTGIYISNIISGSGAETAGLQAGDILIAVNSTEIKTMTDLSDILAEFSVNDTVEVKVIRRNQVGTLEVTLGSLKSGF